MKLKIWHNSNLGNPHFTREVPNIETAKQWLKLLAAYDLYQGERVTANAQGLMVLNENGEWDEWEHPDDGRPITDVMDEEGNDLSPVETIQRIQVNTAVHFGVTTSEIVGQNRQGHIVMPRHVGMYLARRHTRMSLRQIGEMFGGRDHGTVLHACQSTEIKIMTSPHVKKSVLTIEQSLGFTA